MLDLDVVREALPDYEIQGELGRGASGVVLSGHHRTLGRDVAIKQLPAAFAADPAARSRFVAEAKLLASLSHPHIVPVYDYVERDGTCLLVMEALSGGTVWQRARDAGFSPEAACTAALACLAGLEAAHRRGVLHRDVKPENLLFSADGLLKVADFGIAKGADSLQTFATQTGVVLGTPAYMAPEQAKGEELRPATDVYATAIVLFELLAGRLPFPEEGDAFAVVYRHVHEDPLDLRSVAPTVGAHVGQAVMRGLARSPDDRYSTAEDFAVAVGAAATADWGPGWRERGGVPLMTTERVMATTGSGPAVSVPSEGEPTPEATVEHTRGQTVVSRPPPGPTVVSAPRTDDEKHRRGRIDRKVWIGAGTGLVLLIAAALLLTRGGNGGEEPGRAGSDRPGGQAGGVPGDATTLSPPPDGTAVVGTTDDRRLLADFGSATVDLAEALGPDGDDGFLDVSNDGGTVAWRTDRYGCEGNPCLAVADRSLADPTPVRFGAEVVTPTGDIAVGPDGAFIVYTDDEGPHGSDIAVVRRSREGWAEPVILTEGSAFEDNQLPEVDPEGTFVVFECHNEVDRSDAAICRVPVAGGDVERIVAPDAGPDQGTTGAHHPAVEPGGTVVFQAAWNGAPQLWRYDDGEVTVVAERFTEESAPCVLPDGRILSAWYAPEAEGVPLLKVMEPDGSAYQLPIEGGIDSSFVNCGG